ncbi:MAG: membrane protein insertion efficiency factor YidD [Planctomycetota bacterium]|nr:membrane protein insertion efficiency factor YidD [Planctomycetota bacterium]
MIRAILVLLLRGYQAVLSPLIPAACRFEPTCSQYAVEAITRHGPLRGLWLTAGRLLRCRPGGGGGHDPIP